MRYYFHCTNGSALIIDRTGRRVRSDGDVERKARSMARRLMRQIFVAPSWAGWMVCVHNETGEQVEVVGFPRLGVARFAPIEKKRSDPIGIMQADLRACVA